LNYILINIKKGRLLKITIAKQIYHLTYRELANRKDILEITILYLSLIILNKPIIAIIDSTYFKTRILKNLKHISIKLHSIYDSNKLIFIMVIASKEEIADSIMLKPSVKKVIKFLNISKIIGDSAYS